MSLNCIVVTPAETAVETEASSITLPLFDGNKGVMSDHAPMICLLYTSPSPRDLSTSRMPSSA